MTYRGAIWQLLWWWCECYYLGPTHSWHILVRAGHFFGTYCDDGVSALLGSNTEVTDLDLSWSHFGSYSDDGVSALLGSNTQNTYLGASWSHFLALIVMMVWVLLFGSNTQMTYLGASWSHFWQWLRGWQIFIFIRIYRNFLSQPDIFFAVLSLHWNRSPNSLIFTSFRCNWESFQNFVNNWNNIYFCSLLLTNDWFPFKQWLWTEKWIKW